MSEDTFEAARDLEVAPESLDVDVDVGSLSSVTLARLVSEVRNEEPATVRSYDRTHNRHNR